MVAIVDDDRSVRRAVGRLLHSAGYTVETYGSARDFLAAEPEGRTAVALLDIKMEGMTGFELQEELAARHSAIPLKRAVHPLRAMAGLDQSPIPARPDPC